MMLSKREQISVMTRPYYWGDQIDSQELNKEAKQNIP
jgi:hypothetical protein